MHRKEHEKFSAGDVRRVSAGRCSSRKLRTGWMAGLCLSVSDGLWKEAAEGGAEAVRRHYVEGGEHGQIDVGAPGGH